MLHPLYIVLLCMVPIWFVLVVTLFKRLESLHPEKYESMGRPTMFWRNSTEGMFKMLKFLFLREHKSMNDNRLSLQSDLMLVFICCYFLILFSLFFGFTRELPPHAP